MGKFRQVVSVSSAVAISALLASATLSAAPEEHFVEKGNYKIYNVVDLTDPCTGESAVATVYGQGHLGLVSDGNGGGHVNFFETAHGDAIGEFGTIYNVRQTDVAVGNATLEPGTEDEPRSQVVMAVVSLDFVSLGRGENYIAHGVAQIHFTPSGMTRDFMITSTECRG